MKESIFILPLVAMLVVAFGVFVAPFLFKNRPVVVKYPLENLDSATLALLGYKKEIDSNGNIKLLKL